MSKEEYLALASAQYDAISSLSSETNFFTYEERFEDIWLSLGREVLERNISVLPTNVQKKRKFLPDLGK